MHKDEVFDTVAVSVPVPDAAAFPDGWSRTFTNRETGELLSRVVTTQATLADGLPVKIVHSYGRSLLRFESSIPRLMGRAADELATADEVRVVVHRVVDEAMEMLGTKPLGEPTLSRVDVARQFIVPLLFTGSIADIGHALGATVLRDSRTGAPTVMVGAGGEKVLRLYDKTVEAQLPVRGNNGVWRFEVQLRGQAARRRGLRDLDTLGAERAIECARDAFLRSGIGSTVRTSVLDMRAAIEASIAAGMKNVEQVIGYKLLRDMGLRTTKHRTTTARYEQALQEMALPALLEPRAASLRLDWDLGCAVAEPADGDRAEY